MKHPKPTNIHSLRAGTSFAPTATTPFPFTMAVTNNEWKKILHTRRCPCGKGLKSVVAFRVITITLCKANHEVEL